MKSGAPEVTSDVGMFAFNIAGQLPSLITGHVFSRRSERQIDVAALVTRIWRRRQEIG